MRFHYINIKATRSRNGISLKPIGVNCNVTKIVNALLVYVVMRGKIIFIAYFNIKIV